MGWNSGTILFDTVVGELAAHDVDINITLSVAKSLAREMERMDWDGACESEWWDHPDIGKVLENKFEDEEEED